MEFLFCLGFDFIYVYIYLFIFIKNNFENLAVQTARCFTSLHENTPDFIFSSSGFYSTLTLFVTLISEHTKGSPFSS